MAAQAGGDGPAAIGTRLRAAREKKSLTVLQAAEKLHVDSRVVEALEAEDFAALGAAVYARGHLRHYAELVGEQAAELQELYANATRAVPKQPDLTRISRPTPEPNSGKYAGPAVVVLVAIASIGTVWWLMKHPTEKPLPALVHSRAQPTSLAPDESAASGADTPSGAPAESGRPNTPAGRPVATPTQTPTPTPRRGVPAKGPDVGAKTSAQPAVSQTRSPGSAAPVLATANASSVAASATRPTTAPPPGPHMASLNLTGSASSAATPPTSRGKEGQLTLKFSSDSWAEVYDAAGQRLFYDVGAASTAHTVKGQVPLRVVLGNGPGVALEFNGRATPVPATAAADGSVRFLINAHGHAVPATNGE